MLENNKIVVVGGGHAGIESALAISKRGYDCTVITQNKHAIGRLSCNPAIGGLAKGHLVKEIDALGGIMGLAADYATIQNKILNKSKGRAVWSPRSQVDKLVYTEYVQKAIFTNQNIKIVENEVVDFETKKNAISSVKLKTGELINCKALIITCGTFMSGLIHIGNKQFKGGRMGEKRSYGLTDILKKRGLHVKRLKTGTPPRVLSNSVNWSKLELAPGEEKPKAFSLFTPKPYRPKNIPCYLAYTTKKTHQIIKMNLHRSAMFSGKITGVGPRYCPSVEDKIDRFSDKNQHQLFLEPEWEGSNQIYVNGFPTSLPEEVQLEALKQVKGLENVQLIRPGYAIEYDYFPSHQLKATLETKAISGLFFAGQINGTSGYEEAAAQGLVAGVNAVSYVFNIKPLILSRSESYIGVMIDDLITKNINEPYRMFTSRAENRLSLRSETAYFRLSKLAVEFGLYDQNQEKIFKAFLKKYKELTALVTKVSYIYNENKLKLSELLKRPAFTFNSMSGKLIKMIKSSYSDEVMFCVETAIKYKGYEAREQQRILKIKNMENHLIPSSTNYNNILSLSNESREKLSLVRPETLGQASRIDGVRSSDLAVLSVHLSNKVSRETN